MTTRARSRSARSAALAAGSFIALVVVVACPATGCRQVVGIESSPHFDGPAPDTAKSCGVTFANPDCETCMASECCGQADTCAGAAHCGDFATCVGACANGDLACASTCRGRFSASYGAEAASLEGCKATRCATACGATCGGFVYPSEACGACTNKHCCDLASACAASAQCSTLVACEHACAVADDVCLQRCELAHPRGVAPARALGQCAASACAASCIQPHWACLTADTMPRAPVGPPISITYRVGDYFTSQAIPDMQVRLCGTTDPNCSNAPVAGSTLADGTALVHAGDNHFEGVAEISKAGYPPLLVYLPSLTGDFVTPTFGTTTSGNFAQVAKGIAPPIDGRGNIFVYVRDCFGATAGGVSFTVDPPGASTSFYFSATLPSTTATATDALYGIGGFINVTGGTAITIRATVKENGLSYPPVTVQARPNNDSATAVVLYAAPQ